MFSLLFLHKNALLERKEPVSVTVFEGYRHVILTSSAGFSRTNVARKVGINWPKRWFSHQRVELETAHCVPTQAGEKSACAFWCRADLPTEVTWKHFSPGDLAVEPQPVCSTLTAMAFLFCFNISMYLLYISCLLPLHKGFWHFSAVYKR